MDGINDIKSETPNLMVTLLKRTQLFNAEHYKIYM